MIKMGQSAIRLDIKPRENLIDAKKKRTRIPVRLPKNSIENVSAIIDAHSESYVRSFVSHQKFCNLTK